MCQINEKIKPEYWPSKIPFLVGIDKSTNKAFYYKFNLLGFSELNTINTTGIPLDIATSKNGDIFILFEDRLKIFNYDFKFNELKKTTEYPLKDGKKLNSNHAETIGVITDKLIYLFSFKNKKLKKINTLTKKINNSLEDEMLVNINIAPNNSIAILSTENIYFFTKRGTLNKKIKNNTNLNLIDSTAYSDFIFGSNTSKLITKFSQNTELLFSEELKELKAPIHNFSIYKSYGDFVVFNFTEGAYYSMKTTVKIKSCEQLIKNEKLNLKCNINLTFPSTIEATLINNNDQSIPLEKRVLIAGSHVVMWKNIPIEFKDSSIEFLTKGLYSNQNILKNKIKLNVRN